MLLATKSDLKLLFFSSAGSSFENFREIVFKMYTDNSLRFYKKLMKYSPGTAVKVSEMLIHSMASLYLSFIEEILVHDPDDAELENYITQMAVFVNNGTRSILVQHKEQMK